jgi:hypothetical protein
MPRILFSPHCSVPYLTVRQLPTNQQVKISFHSGIDFTFLVLNKKKLSVHLDYREKPTNFYDKGG